MLAELTEAFILTSPSTLLAPLKTIEHAWRFVRQNQYARKIAEQTGKLYDRLCAFVAQEAHGNAPLRPAIVTSP